MRLCWVILAKTYSPILPLVLDSVQVVCAVVVVPAPADMFLILNGRSCKMSANIEQYMQLFGIICNEGVAMARCACVVCNSCTCACSCRVAPELEEIEW